MCWPPLQPFCIALTWQSGHKTALTGQLQIARIWGNLWVVEIQHSPPNRSPALVPTLRAWLDPIDWDPNIANAISSLLVAKSHEIYS